MIQGFLLSLSGRAGVPRHCSKACTGEGEIHKQGCEVAAGLAWQIMCRQYQESGATGEQTDLATPIVLAAKDKHIQVPNMAVRGYQVFLLENGTWNTDICFR